MTTSLSDEEYLDQVSRAEGEYYPRELKDLAESEHIDRWVKQAADGAPPLSQEQIDKIRVLMGGAP